MVDDALSVPQGTFTVRRRHHDPTGSLRGWDAADEYVLDHVAAEGARSGRWLVVNDGFGALAVAGVAAGNHVTSWTDSSVAHAATAENLDANGLDARSADLVPATMTPDGPIDVVIVKIPRALAHLEDELLRIRPRLTGESLVVGAGMTRHVHRSTIEVFERTIGPSPTTRARKKARLLLAVFDPDLEPPPSAFPVRWSTPDGIEVTARPNVFSATRLDHGTRLLLDHLPSPAAGASVLDLGCGTGVIAATLARRHPSIDVVCCDESYEAVESARRTVGGVTDGSSFHVTDVLDAIDDQCVDVVVSNPPFHAGGARTTEVAVRMIDEAHRVLRDGGEVRMVANRHLDHHRTIARRFGSVDVVAADSRFTVLSARRRSRR